MVGTLPRTRLLLVASNTVIEGNFANYSEIGHYFGIKVSDDGVVNFNGEDQLPHYIMGGVGGWKSKADVIRDWCCYHLKLPSGYGIYRYLS